MYLIGADDVHDGSEENIIIHNTPHFFFLNIFL
jgi:hypothetical protein